MAEFQPRKAIFKSYQRFGSDWQWEINGFLKGEAVPFIEGLVKSSKGRTTPGIRGSPHGGNIDYGAYADFMPRAGELDAIQKARFGYRSPFFSRLLEVLLKKEASVASMRDFLNGWFDWAATNGGVLFSINPMSELSFRMNDVSAAVGYSYGGMDHRAYILTNYNYESAWLIGLCFLYSGFIILNPRNPGYMHYGRDATDAYFSDSDQRVIDNIESHGIPVINAASTAIHEADHSRISLDMAACMNFQDFEARVSNEEVQVFLEHSAYLAQLRDGPDPAGELKSLLFLIMHRADYVHQQGAERAVSSLVLPDFDYRRGGFQEAAPALNRLTSGQEIRARADKAIGMLDTMIPLLGCL
ncbi:MAG: hypothetical protein ACP5NX_02925 [Candidatus Bilamarchaeaceae archaeon]